MKTDCWICTSKHQIKRIRDIAFSYFMGLQNSGELGRLFPKYTTIKPADNFLNAAKARFSLPRSTSHLLDRYIACRSAFTSTDYDSDYYITS